MVTTRHCLQGNFGRGRLVVGAGLTLVVCLLLACDNSDEEKPYAPANCDRVPPTTGFIVATVTINAEHHRVPVSVYRGDYEKLNLVAADTTETEKVSFELPPEKSYAVTARYIVGTDTVLVLAGTRLDLEKDEFRDATCYSVPDRNVDLKLRK